MSEQNVQAIRGLYDAFNRGDLDTLERGFAREFVWNEAENSLYSGGNPYRNFAAVRDGVFGPTARDFDQFSCDVEQLLDAGDHLVAIGRYRGKSRETGQPLNSQFCHVTHFDLDGRIDRVQSFTDTLQEAQVTGRAPAIAEIKIPHPVM